MIPACIPHDVLCASSRNKRSCSQVNIRNKMASPGSSRGYPVYFAKQPPKEIPAECPIYLHVLCQPKMVSCCGHSFCAACIGRVASDQKPCPLCGQQFTLADNKVAGANTEWLWCILSTPGERMWMNRRAWTAQTPPQPKSPTWQGTWRMSVSKYSMWALSVMSMWTLSNGRPCFEWLSESWHWMWI